MRKTIKEWRTVRNMSQLQLSAESGVAQASVSRLESGIDQNVRPGTIRCIVRALGIKFEDLNLENIHIIEPKASQPKANPKSETSTLLPDQTPDEKAVEPDKSPKQKANGKMKKQETVNQFSISFRGSDDYLEDTRKKITKVFAEK